MQKIMKRKSLTAGVQGPLEGPRCSRVLHALSCYLSLFFFKHSDKKWDTKKCSQTQFFFGGEGGGGEGDCCTPLWIHH